MQGNFLIKTARVGFDLVSHPQYIKPYLGFHLSKSRSPIDLELPWFSYSSILFLNKALRPGMVLYEYGSGGSTLYFAKHCARVVSIEDDQRWHREVGKILQERGISNAELRFVPADLKSVEAFLRSPYPEALPNEAADVIVVDGCDRDGPQVRPACFAIAEGRVKKGGMIIVDDSWRYPELRIHNKARKFRTFTSIGPARFGVTSTDIFFY